MQRDDTQRPIETPASRPLRADTTRRTDYSLHFVLLATVGFFVARLPVLSHRIFDPDEFQHSHAAWCVWRGMLPYKDFFEHHTPWYYYMLRPFFRWFDVAGSFESARHFLIFGRVLSLVLTILSVFLIILIGRLWQDRRVGLLAGLFLVGQPVVFEKTIEIRPDALALPFFLGGLWLVLCGLARSKDSAARSLRCFFAGGLSLGAAIMCTQKMLFVLPGVLAGLGIWLLTAGRVGSRRALLAADHRGRVWRGRAQRAGRGGGWGAEGQSEPSQGSHVGVALRSRVFPTTAFAGGLAVPATLTWAWFALHHAGGNFIANNFLLNSNWTHVAHEQLLRVLEGSWPILILCLLGTTVSLYQFFRSKQRQHGGFLLFCTLAGLIAGILVVPVAHRQYYLMPLPIACLFAAQGLCFLVDRAQERARAWLLVLAIVPLAILPVLDLREALTLRNDSQLTRLRRVFDATKPTDVVMDGWEGMGVFRPHAFHYYFLHDESVAMLPQEQVDAYLDALESGKIRPSLIAMDDHLVALGSRFLRFVKTNYVSSDGFLYLLRDDH